LGRGLGDLANRYAEAGDLPTPARFVLNDDGSAADQWILRPEP
jgi:hypothetical protein